MKIASVFYKVLYLSKSQSYRKLNLDIIIAYNNSFLLLAYLNKINPNLCIALNKRMP